MSSFANQCENSSCCLATPSNRFRQQPRLLPETACLVADVHMPGMTGVEFHARLIKLGHAIPTILVTAYPDEAVRDRALKDGVVCYLSKPVDDGELEGYLRTALKRGTPNKKIHDPSSAVGRMN